jgi:hypothetical protein
VTPLVRFGIVAIVTVIAALVPWPPALVESVYSGGIYPHIQPIVTTLSNLVPFALLDLLVAAALLTIAWSGRRAWRRHRLALRTAAACTLTGAGLACGAFLWFLVLWGFNYQRLPAVSRFDAEPSRVNDAAIRQAARTAVDRVNDTFNPARRADLLEAPALVPRLAPAFAAARRELGMTWPMVPGRPKWSLAGTVFPLIGVDGMMDPLALEVILNPDVLPFERPFVLAHEWGHLAGLAGESDASFVAWLACLAGDRDAQYSGWQAFLIHLLRVLPEADAQRALDALAAGPASDMAAISQRLRRRSHLASAASRRVYDRYLKANGIDAGVANYDDVVRLAISTPAGLSHLR